MTHERVKLVKEAAKLQAGPLMEAFNAFLVEQGDDFKGLPEPRRRNECDPRAISCWMHLATQWRMKTILQALVVSLVLCTVTVAQDQSGSGIKNYSLQDFFR